MGSKPFGYWNIISLWIGSILGNLIVKQLAFTLNFQVVNFFNWLALSNCKDAINQRKSFYNVDGYRFTYLPTIGAV